MSDSTTLEIDYHRASNGKLFASNFFDAFAMLILSFLLLILNNFIFFKCMPSGINTKAERDEIILSSHLYQKDENGSINLTYVLIKDDNNKSSNEKSEQFDMTLTLFFTDFVKDISIYNNYKKEAKNSDGYILFKEENNNYIRALTNSDYDNTYYNFYLDIIENKATGYLQSNSNYVKNLKKEVLQNLVLFYLSLIISNFVFYYLFPVIFYRGRKTLGMKIANVGLVSVDGMNVKLSRFTLRYLFYFIVIITLSLVSFLIPIIVSLTMMLLSKSGQSLTDYVFNTYKIDTSSSSIYLNKQEYIFLTDKKEEIKFEDVKTDI